jgi:hypothetical protein
MKKSRANKGQFSVIAALLVSVILVTAVISTYTLVRHAPIEDSPKVLTAVGEMNADIKQILDFTVGYYGSILKVTGNSEYARNLTTNYLSSGLVNIARSHPEWNPSFDLTSKNFATSWFMPESFSMGNLSVTYSLQSLGINGVKYETSSALEVTMLESDPGVARIMVTRDNSEPELGLNKDNFRFYNYTGGSTWDLINPTSIIISSNGVYNITLPSGIDSDAYSVQVEDNRGLMVSAFYSQNSVASDSKIPHYTYTFDWNSTGMLEIYNSLNTDTFVIELLQNGTLKWLGQPLGVTPSAKPIPPVAVKAFRVNATISGVDQQVPFQVEDWASDYMVPLGLSDDDSIFSNTNMLVFLVNNEVEKITVWWDGNDTATQTSYAQQENFNGDVSDTYHVSLSNGIIDLDVDIDSARLSVTSTAGPTSEAEFLRINGERPVFHAGTSCVIYNGSVRTILQQEPEYSSGGATDLYSQLILTLPLNTNYYTYTSRIIFVDTTQDRTIDDLSVVQLSNLVGTPITENGTLAIYPNPSYSTGSFYDCSPTGWDHHWSQFVLGPAGAGVMFTDSNNEQLYAFDSVIGADTGAIVVENTTSNYIEVNPVEINPVSFDSSRDLTWYGAVVTFTSESIYHSGDDVGLWVMVEHPPGVMMDDYESTYVTDIDYVDSSLSNKDSSTDKGTHSAFAAQKYGPDSIFDTLQESNAGGPEQWISPTGYVDPLGNWQSETNAYDDNTGTYAYISVPGSSWSSYLELTHSDITCDKIRYWISRQNAAIDLVEIDIYNGGWVNVYSGAGTWQQWANVSFSETSVTKLRFRFHNSNSQSRQARVYEADFLALPPINYKLDLEVQWTHADFDEANEELCIYVGAASGEGLRVDVWTGSWTSLTTLNVGWNNVTVSSYLTSEEFTIRFVGETETGDITQDYWTIDATLLHCWT